MTVANNDRLKQVTATGGETTLPYDFTLAAKTHLVVTEEDTAGAVVTLVVDVDYTVNGVGQIGGSTITLDTTLYPSGATAAHIFTLSGNTPAERLADFALRGDLSSVQLNSEQDAVINIVQQIQRDVDRAYSLPLSDGEGVVTTVPSKTARASKFWSWDAQGDLVAAAGTSANLGPVSAFIDTLLDDVDAATARATLLTGPQIQLAKATTSGTAHAFTSGVLGAKRIRARFDGVSTIASSVPILQIGNSSSGYLVSGYTGGVSTISANSVLTGEGCPLLHAASATVELTGIIDFEQIVGFSDLWAFSGQIVDEVTGAITFVVGRCALTGGAIDRLRLTTVVGTDFFNAGLFNITVQT